MQLSKNNAPTKQLLILNFIFGKYEVRLSDIQEFVCKMNGRNWDRMQTETVWNYKSRETMLAKRRANRGYYLQRLCAASDMRAAYERGEIEKHDRRLGLLVRYAEKTDGRWKLNKDGYELVSKAKSLRII